MPVSRPRVNPETPATPGTSGRRYGGIDPEERQRQRKAKLIEAGLIVFGEKGYHQATVRDVCRQAQLTSRYFYESFDGMEALFRAVYVSVSRELMQAVVMSLVTCEPQAEKLAEASLRTFFEFIQHDPRRARVALIDVNNIGEGMTALADRASQDFAQLLASFMYQMFPRLAGSELDFQMLSNGLVGANMRIATQWVADRCRTPIEEVLRNVFMLYQACIKHARDLEKDIIQAATPGEAAAVSK